MTHSALLFRLLGLRWRRDDEGGAHRVDDQAFYQLRQNGITDDIHLFNEKLREWEDYYNYHRPHGALGGQTPYERLLAKTRAEELPKP